MLTATTFRTLALALPDVVEGCHQGHPDFRANGRVLASPHPDGLSAMVKVAAAQQCALVAAAPAVFAPASGAWGRAGCTMLVLALADAATVRQALQDAWTVAMAMAMPKGRSAKAPTGRTATPRPKKPR